MKQQTRKQPEPKIDGSKPVKTFVLKGVRVSVFANTTNVEGREVVFYKVATTKTYREGEEFKSTTSLGRDDLPVAVILLEDAYRWILQAEADARRSDGE